MNNEESIETLQLSDLCKSKPERPGWSLTFGASCAEAAAVCLEERGHGEQVAIQVNGIQTLPINIVRDKVNDTMQRFNADKEVATEYGAYGISALVMPSLTGLTVIERSVKGRGFGFDFWLGDVSAEQGMFQRKARLEVSGIRQGSESDVRSRVRVKLKQISPSDEVAPGYVAVIEFGKPQARIVEKCRL
ncbi:MAG: hypothetical protein AAFQ95_21975 [Cyanobacteria bacterium J06621_3]